MRQSWIRSLLVPPAAFLLTFFVTSCVFFSSREVKTNETYSFERRSYFRDMLLTAKGLSFESENFLRGNLLMGEIERNPKEILRKLQMQYNVSHNNKYLAIAADYCCWKAAASENEEAVRYALTALYYLHEALPNGMGAGEEQQLLEHDILPFQLVLTYNECSSIIFDYLQNRNLLEHDAFFFRDMEDRIYRFEKPVYQLSLPQDALKNLSLCSRYTTKDLMLKNCRVGIGVPLIGEIKAKKLFRSFQPTKRMRIPVTMLLDIQKGPDLVAHLRFHFIDTTLQENIKILENEPNWPLSLDFSTPLAAFLNDQPERNLISVMLHPDEMEDTGLYMIDPYHPSKIPVLFVHGLMSSPETWMQMINTLKNDPTIRKKYQFWFYQYSSGSPVVASAHGLRQALLDAQKELCTTPEATENFNRMIVVGHSMGGMLTRMLVLENPYVFLEGFSNLPWAKLQKKLPPQELKICEKYLLLPPLPFVSRVIFMAVPHRGAKMAKSLLGWLGISLINLPGELIHEFNAFAEIFSRENETSELGEKIAGHCTTGIENLDPENTFVKIFAETEIKKGLAYHCIIGNENTEDQPGGSDGIVPYTSSHLDGAASEVIVKSGHSVHRTPRAMLEISRILRLHLTEKK